MGCLCCKSAVPEPSPASQCVADVGTSCSAAGSCHRQEFYLPHAVTRNCNGRSVRPEKTTEQRKKKRERKASNTNQHSPKEPQSAPGSHDLSVSAAADFQSSQSIEATAVCGPFRSCKRPIIPSHSRGMGPEEPGHNQNNDSSFWNGTDEGKLSKKEDIVAKGFLHSIISRRDKGRTDVINTHVVRHTPAVKKGKIIHVLPISSGDSSTTHPALKARKEDNVTREERQKKGAVITNKMSHNVVTSRNTNAADAVNIAATRVTPVAKKSKVISVLPISSRDYSTTHPANEAETVHIQPVSGRVREADDVANTQSKSLTMDGTERIGDTGEERQRMPPVPNQTTATARTEETLRDKDVPACSTVQSVARRPLMAWSGEVKEAWTERGSKKRKSWNVLHWVRKRKEVSPVLDRSSNAVTKHQVIHVVSSRHMNTTHTVNKDETVNTQPVNGKRYKDGGLMYNTQSDRLSLKDIENVHDTSEERQHTPLNHTNNTASTPDSPLYDVIPGKNLRRRGL